MEYEICDRPQLADEDAYDRFAARHREGPMPAAFIAPRRADRSDRAIAIPEQEAGS